MALPSPRSMLSPVATLSARHPRAAGYRGSDFVHWHEAEEFRSAAISSAIGGATDAPSRSWPVVLALARSSMCSSPPAGDFNARFLRLIYAPAMPLPPLGARLVAKFLNYATAHLHDLHLLDPDSCRKSAVRPTGKSAVCHERRREYWRCATVREMKEALRGRQSGAGLKPLQAAIAKSNGGERCRKAGTRFRQARLSEASASKPPMKCRNFLDDVRTGGWHCLRDQLGGRPDVCPSGIRHVGGATLNQALVRNVRTCAPMPRERSQAARTARIGVPKRSAGAEQPVVVMKVL